MKKLLRKLLILLIIILDVNVNEVEKIRRYKFIRELQHIKLLAKRHPNELIKYCKNIDVRVIGKDDIRT